MVRKIDYNRMGVITYSMSDVANDLDKLPKKGIATSSTAQGILNGELVIYYFTARYDANGVEIDGVTNSYK